MHFHLKDIFSDSVVQGMFLKNLMYKFEHGSVGNTECYLDHSGNLTATEYHYSAKLQYLFALLQRISIQNRSPAPCYIDVAGFSASFPESIPLSGNEMDRFDKESMKYRSLCIFGIDFA